MKELHDQKETGLKRRKNLFQIISTITHEFLQLGGGVSVSIMFGDLLSTIGYNLQICTEHPQVLHLTC